MTLVKEKLLLWTGVALCLAYLLPNHYSPWLSFHQELVAAIAFAPLLAWASTRASEVPAITYGAVLLALVPLLQVASGQLYFATDGWMSCLYLMGFALSAHAGAQGAFTPLPGRRSFQSPVEVIWIAMLFAALLSAGLAFHQWLIPTYRGIYIAEIPPESRPFGNLAQPNQLATLLLLGIAGLVYLWEAGRLRRLYAMAALFLLLWALVMTGSRSVLLALLWFLPAYALMRKRCHLRTKPVAVIFGVAFYFVITWLWPMLDEILLLNTAGINTAVERMGTPGIRRVIWWSMLDAVSRAPWFGYGWGQISLAQIAGTLNHAPTHLVLESSHNLFLDLALWNGLPIAVLVIAGLACWLVHQARACNDPMRWVTLVGVGFVFSHAMVEYPLSYAYFLLPVGFFMGALSIAQGVPSRFNSAGPKRRFARWALIVTGTFTAGLAVSVAIEYFPLESDWSLMRYQEARIGSREMTEPPAALVLTSIQEFLRFSRSEARSDMTDQALEAMRRSSERFAYAAPMFKYALAQALNHRSEGAVTTLQKLCSMQPRSVCISAQKEWNDLAKNRYPQLLQIAFPDAGAIQ